MIPITCNAVGDILAVATLVLDIARALDESRGSPAKYRAFTSELKSLHIVLASVARVAELTNDALLRDEIVREVDRCGNDVRRTLERVAKFSALGRDASSDDIMRIRMKRQWYKLEWRFGYHGSVDSIRDELAMATQRLTAYLVVLNADGIQDLRASITDHFTAMTAQICSSLMEQFAGINSRYTELSHPAHYPPAAAGELHVTPRRDSPLFSGVLGNAPNGLDSSKAAAAALLCLAICTMHDTSRSLHSALLLVAFGILMCSMARDERGTSLNVGYTQSNSVTFHDAMGRRLVLPIELCETRELFHATLVNLFSRMKGSWFIHDHRYMIARKGEHERIDDRDWNRAFRPGTEIEMAIVVQLTGSERRWSIWCPVCMARRSKTGNADKVICSGCGRLLRWFSGVLYERRQDWGNDSRKSPESVASIASDWGRFPRARPTLNSTPSPDPRHKTPDPRHKTTDPRHITPGPLHDPRTNLPNVRESLLREGNSAALLSHDWVAQVQGFKHFRINERLGLHLYRYKSPCGLSAAVENGGYALVAALLDGGADVNACDDLGWTALHFACASGNTRIAELLLDRNAVIDAFTTHGITPFACAVGSQKHDITALLLSRGAIVDAPRHLQVPVLDLAALFGNIDVMRMLLRLGVNADTRIKTGVSILQNAIRRRASKCFEIVELLLQFGANVDASSPYGSTPLLDAAWSGRGDVFHLLLASGSVLRPSAQPFGCDEYWRSDILYGAVVGGSQSIVATVLEHTKADVNAPFPDGSTPLSLASERIRVDIVQLLLARGADPNAESVPSQWIRTVNGIREESWKALHAAATASGSVRAAAIEALLLHGADVNAQTDLGSTPLLLALLGVDPWGSDAVVDILLSRNAKATGERTSRLLQEYLARTRTNTVPSRFPGAWSDGIKANSDPDSILPEI